MFSYDNVLFKQDNNRCKMTNFPILVSPKYQKYLYIFTYNNSPTTTFIPITNKFFS